RELVLKKKLIIYISSLVLSIGFLFAFNPMKRESDIVRFLMISFGFHLLVAFAAFIGRENQVNAFWQFNKTLFLRFLTGVLYSGVLYVGLCAAVASMNFLFNFDFQSDTFSIMGVWIIGMFQTIFFLAGVPSDLRSLQEDLSYPKGLKLFTQYVLIPLASVYVVILLSYEIKILVQWNLPKGLVSSLILGYAVFGILSFLLIYPLRNLEENKWIKTFSKSFYFLLVPLLILLYLAIYTRVENYGITEGRYFLIVLALWLSFITLYFLLSKRENIIVIPLTLCIITIIGVYGPLSAFSIAEKSQLRQLKEVLLKNKMLVNGKLQPLAQKLDSADNDRIRDISRYMIDKYGLESLQPIISEDLTTVKDSIILSLNKSIKGRRRYNKWDLDEDARSWLNKHYKIPVDYYYHEEDSYTVVAELEDLIPLNTAEYLVEINNYNESKVQLEKNKELQCDITDASINIRIGNDSVKVNLYKIINQLHKEVSMSDQGNKKQTVAKNQDILTVEDNAIVLPRTSLTQQLNLNGYDIVIMINRIQYRITNNTKTLVSTNGALLLKKEN
ncbi:MAG: DUF4153 domain-containing protein, partial [Sphingobacteriaceae bacterium]